MFSRAELMVIAMAIERAENRLELQREMTFGMGQDWALAAAFIKSMELQLALLHESRRVLNEAAMLEPFKD